MNFKVILASTLCAIACANSVMAACDPASDKKYEAQSAAAKMNALWTRITANTTPLPWFSLGEVFIKLVTENLGLSFSSAQDCMPDGHKKYIHTEGIVAKGRYRPTGGASSELTGLFQGADNLLIRLSLAKQPSARVPGGPGIAPGVAIKGLRDKVSSANFFAMFSLDGQSGWNFFENTLSNHVDPPVDVGLILLSKAFRRASNWETMVGLKDFADFDSKGIKSDEPVFPFQLFLEPNADLKAKFAGMDADINENSWLTLLASNIPAGSVLYKIYAKMSPKSERELIGEIVNDSTFVTSRYGDEMLYFKHSLMEDDFKRFPAWHDEL